MDLAETVLCKEEEEERYETRVFFFFKIFYLSSLLGIVPCFSPILWLLYVDFLPFL